MPNIDATCGRVCLGLEPRGKDDHIDRDSPHYAGEGIFSPYNKLPLFFRLYRPVGHLGDAAADELDPLVEELVVELLVALARGTHIDVEVVDLGARLLLDHMGKLQGVHAADPGALPVRILVAGPTQWMMPPFSDVGRPEGRPRRPSDRKRS